MIGFTLGLGVTSALAAPAQAALVVSLVPASKLPTAVALNSMTFNVARALGPALAALSVATLGIPASFAINAASYLFFVGALLAIRPRPQERAVAPRLRESLALLRADPRLLGFLVIVAIVGYASDPVNTLAPAFAVEFGRPDTTAGVIIGAFGAGAVTAALVVAGRSAGSRTRMAATLLLLGGGVIGFALSPWLPLGVLLPLHRRLRLPRLEHCRHDETPAGSGGEPEGAHHGALEHRLPRPAAAREPPRRRRGVGRGRARGRCPARPTRARGGNCSAAAPSAPELGHETDA